MAKFVTLLTRRGTAMLKLVMLIGVIAAAVTVVYSATQQEKAVEKAIRQYISVASSQYNKGLYETAKDGLKSVRSEYASILTESQQSQIEDLLGKVGAALEQRALAGLQLGEASDALNEGQYAKAAELLKQVRSNKFASDAQKDQAAARLKAAEEKITAYSAEMKALFDSSFELYRQGDFDAAEAGFEQVAASGVRVSRWFGQDSDYFLGKISESRQKSALEAQKAEQARKEAEAKAVADAKAAAEAEAKAAAEAEKRVAEEARIAAEKARQDAKIAAEKAAQEAQAAERAEFEAQMKTLFDDSYELYRQGSLAEAKEGFSQVAASGVRAGHLFGRDSQHYISRIDREIEAQVAAEVKAAEQAKLEAQKAEQARKDAEAKALADAKARAEAEVAAKARKEVEAAAKAEAKAGAEAEKRAAEEAKIVAEKAQRDAQAASAAQAQVVQKQEVAAAIPQAEQDIDIVEVGVAVEPSTDSQERSYIRVVQEKRDRQRDYTNAIVSDSVQKANQAVERGDYPAARNALSVAYSNIEKTKMLLGDELYSSYKNQLDRLSSQIQAAQEKAAAEQDRVKRVETEQLQEKIRSGVELQRQNAVKDYLANAMAFQREQRYKEALAQLEALLAIDPLNSIALLQKQTIEDTILWREQVSIQREKHQQEIETLLNADRASIPYSDEVTYPRNWKQIVERRSAHQDNDFSPEDTAVYRALEQIVDLTAFYEDMTFGEAIEILANAMEPPVTIVVLWSDLDMNAFVDRNTPINLRITSPVRAKLGLSLLLSSVAGGLADISYVVTDGVIRVATVESLPDKLIVRRYDVRELLSPSAEFNFEMDTTDYGSQGGGRSAGGGGGTTGGTRSTTSTDDSRYDSDTMRQEAMGRVASIRQLIQETIEPMSWYDAGGEGSIETYSNNILVVRQTLENHQKIRSLIDELRASLGEQVSIEARFLTVTENFLEEIGLDLDMLVSPSSGKWNDIIFSQTHADGARTQSTGVPGSLPGSVASTISGGYILDDLQVSFILEATQAHKDSKTLNAPKVTVLSGESAAIRVQTEFSYVADYQFTDITASGDNQPTRTIADPEIGVIRDGVILNVTPTITADKKYVLLRIMTSYTKTDFETYQIPSDSEGDRGRLYTIQLPISQIADVRTRVTVPDSGTLLIGGQKLTGEMTTEKGVPVLSKMPIIGRLFENRGTRKDSSILLILVKPTIILQDEQERDAIAAMERRF